MKFIHLADVHIGAWKNKALASLPSENFNYVINYAISQKVDFILVAGDLFDSALPGIDYLKSTVRTLQKAKKKAIAVYIIPGSHDYSPSGKSVLGVLEEAGLVHNVYRGEVIEGKLRLEVTIDEKTGVQLVGVLGRKGVLETKQYEELDESYLEQQLNKEKESVFLFHTALDELKPKRLSAMSSSPLSMMPKGFSYYAGGHVHITEEVSMEGYAYVSYPGPVFPASFSEMEELGAGHFIYYDKGNIERKKIPGKEIQSLCLVSENNTPEELTQKTLDNLGETKDKILLLRFKGTLSQGSAADINYKQIRQAAEDAYAILKNTVALHSQDQAEPLKLDLSSEELEEHILKEHVGSSDNIFGDEELAVMKNLLKALSREKQEGETNHGYDERILKDSTALLGLD